MFIGLGLATYSQLDKNSLKATLLFDSLLRRYSVREAADLSPISALKTNCRGCLFLVYLAALTVNDWLTSKRLGTLLEIPVSRELSPHRIMYTDHIN